MLDEEVGRGKGGGFEERGLNEWVDEWSVIAS